MKTAESPIELHMFVCTNQKPPGKECCADKGGKEIREQLKKRISGHPELRQKVRINASGCLDKCTEGVACVIYPQGEWITDVTLEDLDLLESKVLAYVNDL